MRAAGSKPSHKRAWISALAVAVVVVAVLALHPGGGNGSPHRHAASPRPAQLSDATFWKLIADTRTAAGNDPGRQSDLLKSRLSHLSPQAILDFARTRHRLDQGAYTWSLWG